jgi:hypothetical protein
VTPESWNSGARRDVIASQWLGKHVRAELDTHVTVEELMEVVFLCGPCRSYMMRTNGPKTASRVLGVGTCSVRLSVSMEPEESSLLEAAAKQ